MGRPELVGTLPEFRGRGLVRVQFDEIHRWCEARNLLVQGITGIPYFYWQFGYEFALALGGRRFGFKPPKLKESETESFSLRPATEEDIPFLVATYEYSRRRSGISAKWEAAYWHYHLIDMHPQNIHGREWRIIERSATHEAIGYVAFPDSLMGGGLTVTHFELQPGISWLEVTPAVMHALWQVGQEYARLDGGSFETFGFSLGDGHPAYVAMGSLLPGQRDSYAWYLRVPDPVGFLKHIQPVLERRVADSIAAGHSAEYLVGLYPKGFKLVLERGRLVAIEPWQPEHADHGNAGFPGLTFLQVLFGYRSFDELQRAFPDCWSDNDQTQLLFDILFPKRPSLVYGIS